MRFLSRFPLAKFLIIFSCLDVFVYSKFQEHDVLLDEKYRVKWHVIGEEIVFEIDVEAKGLVLFGLSKTGEMEGSDVVTAWVDKGIPYLKDAHGVGDSVLETDSSQDWKLLNGSEVGNHTIFKFSRRLQTCDNDDLEIGDNALRIIWAYSNEDPLSPHALDYTFPNRGSKRVMLLKPLVPDVETYNDEVKHWDAMLMSFKPSNKTKSLQWCKIIKGPDLEEKGKIFREDILLSAKNKTFFHHAILFECAKADGINGQLQRLSKSSGSNCNNIFMLEVQIKCSNLVGGFAVGGEPIELPQNVGFPIVSSRYYLFQVHLEYLDSYNGEEPLEGGLRVFYSSRQDRKDGAVVIGGILGIPIIQGFIKIPPGQESFILSAHLHPKCFDSYIPSEGMKILGVQLHAHWLARRIRVRHFRGNVELPPIADDTNYEFNYQEFRIFQKAVTYLKGDLLTIECTYDTSKKSHTIYYGAFSDDEMCMAFFLYYPKTDVTLCFRYNMPSLLTKTADLLPKNSPKGSLNDDFQNDAFSDSVSKLQWEMKDAPQRSVMYLGGSINIIPEPVSYPENLIEYVKPDVCGGQYKAEQTGDNYIRR